MGVEDRTPTVGTKEKVLSGPFMRQTCLKVSKGEDGW